MRHAAITLTLLALAIPAGAESAAAGQPKAAPATRPDGAPSRTLRGQVVCSACWFEADRESVPYGNKGDLDCAAACAKKSIPPALAVDENGELAIYVLEGKPPAASGSWLDLMGQHVEVTGVTSERDKRKTLAVSKARVLGGPADPAAAHQLPELALEDLNGAKRKLSAERGKPTLVVFWATWCIPCRTEMPALVALRKAYPPEKLVILGASADGSNEKKAVHRFVQEKGLNFPVWIGANASDLKAFGLSESIPATVLLDGSGRPVWRREGIVSEAELRQQIDRLIAAN